MAFRFSTTNGFYFGGYPPTSAVRFEYVNSAKKHRQLFSTYSYVMSDTPDKYEFLRTIGEHSRHLRSIYSFVTHPSRMDRIPLDVRNKFKHEYDTKYATKYATYYDNSVLEQSGGGGNVFKGHSTQRFTTAVHDTILRNITQVLTAHHIRHGYTVNFADKLTHGDVDISVLATDANKLRELLGDGGEFSIYLQDHTPKNTIHMLYVLSDENGTETKHQIDFELAPNVEFSISFCAYGYLGYMLGKVMSHFGFDVQRDGVYITYAGVNSKPHRYLICDNFDKILTDFFDISPKSVGVGVERGDVGVRVGVGRDQTLAGLVQAFTKSDIFVNYPRTFEINVSTVGHKDTVIEFVTAFNDAVRLYLSDPKQHTNSGSIIDPTVVAKSFIARCGKTESLHRWRAAIVDDIGQRRLFTEVFDGNVVQTTLGLNGRELGQKINQLQTIEKITNFADGVGRSIFETVSSELEEKIRHNPDHYLPRDKDQIVVERSIIRLAELGLLTTYIKS